MAIEDSQKPTMLHHLLPSHTLKISLLPSEELLVQLSLSSRWHRDWKDPWLYEEGRRRRQRVCKGLLEYTGNQIVTRTHLGPRFPWWQRKIWLTKSVSGTSSAPCMSTWGYSIPWEAATVSGSIQMDGYRDRDLGEILHCVTWFSRAGSQWCLLQGGGGFLVKFTPKWSTRAQVREQVWLSCCVSR